MKRQDLGRRTVYDIRDQILAEIGHKPTSIIGRRIQAALNDAQISGIRLAASVAAEYDRMSAHDYLVSDCILGKLNVLDRKPRRNEGAVKIEQVLSSLERRVAGIEATSRFLSNVARRSKRCSR